MFHSSMVCMWQVVILQTLMWQPEFPGRNLSSMGQCMRVLFCLPGFLAVHVLLTVTMPYFLPNLLSSHPNICLVLEAYWVLPPLPGKKWRRRFSAFVF